MSSRSNWYFAIGVLTLIYGVVLGVLWGMEVVDGGESLTTAKLKPLWLFASVPVILLVAGSALCWLRTRWTAVTAAVSAVAAALLAAKAALAWHYALGEMQGGDSFSFLDLFRGVVGLILVLVMAIPSGIWSIVLAGTAASLTTGGSANATIPSAAPARRPRTWAFILGAIALALVAQVGGVALLRLTLPDMTGLDGTWKEPANPRHSYTFRPNGELDSRFGGLPHGVIADWSRQGQTIRVRHRRDWHRVDDMDGTLQDGTIQWQKFDRKSGQQLETTVWKREISPP
jgi:hypothetical protein